MYVLVISCAGMITETVSKYCYCMYISGLSYLLPLADENDVRGA